MNIPCHHRQPPLWMCGLLCTVLIAMSIATRGASDPSLNAADWKAIKQVITAQRAALVAGNGEQAFGYASPGIKERFGDAARFIAMVRAGYSALLTARDAEFLDGAVIDGVVIQPLRLVDADNSVRVALYTMEKQKNGVWRISGCRIAPSTLQAA